jgi:hypothetical protein
MSANNYLINRLNTYATEKTQKYIKEYNKVHTTTEPVSNKQTSKTKIK